MFILKIFIRNRSILIYEVQCLKYVSYERDEYEKLAKIFKSLSLPFPISVSLSPSLCETFNGKKDKQRASRFPNIRRHISKILPSFYIHLVCIHVALHAVVN